MSTFSASNPGGPSQSFTKAAGCDLLDQRSLGDIVDSPLNFKLTTFFLTGGKEVGHIDVVSQGSAGATFSGYYHATADGLARSFFVCVKHSSSVDPPTMVLSAWNPTTCHGMVFESWETVGGAPVGLLYKNIEPYDRLSCEVALAPRQQPACPTPEEESFEELLLAFDPAGLGGTLPCMYAQEPEIAFVVGAVRSLRAMPGASDYTTYFPCSG